MQEIYILGVSGGPDSMALFDMCVQNGVNVVAAHMNYHHRDSADRDEQIVNAYCKTHHIIMEVRHQRKECKGNFQAFAREERYAFYKEMCDRYHAKGVLLAHHLDDHLETYLMQKKRGSLSSYYGIREEGMVYDCCVFRPLLQYTKEELLNYCIQHEVPYGLDESNFSDDYERNRIRHTIIAHMSREEKEKLAQEIAEKNSEWKKLYKACSCFLSSWDHSVKQLMKQPEEIKRQSLLMWIYENCHHYISREECDHILALIANKAKNWTRDIQKDYILYQEYGELYIDTSKEISYAYTYDDIRYEMTPFFSICQNGSSTEALTLYKDDFPITIRNVKQGDYIQMRFGKKNIHRWFIDRKILSKDRKRWPVVENAAGNIILVPKIGCDMSHFSNNPNIFVIK